MKKLYCEILILLVSFFCTANAVIFTEDFNDLIYCDAVKTSGGWKVPDSVGYPTSKPLQERAVGNWTNTTGEPQKVRVSGGYAYAASNSGLVKVRISDGVEDASLSLSGTSVDLAISGGNAFVASTSNFYSVDIGAMVQLDALSIPAYGVAIRGDYAYVGGGSNGLYTVDISDPTDIAQVDNDTWTNAGARGIAVFRDYLLVCENGTNMGIRVFKLSTPQNPSFQYSLSLGSGCLYAAVANTLAVVAAGDSIYVLGLSNIGSGLNVLARLGAKNWANDANFYLDKFVVADGDSGMSIFKYGTNAAKTYMMTVSPLNASGTTAMGVALTGDGYFVVADSQGLQFLETGPIDPSNTWDDTLGIGISISMAYDGGNYLFVSCQMPGLVSVDVTDPENLLALDTLPISGITGVDVIGTKAYLCGGTLPYNFYIVDVSDPTNMIPIDSTSIPALVYDVDISGSYAYLACNDGARKLDLLTMSVVETYSTSVQCVSIIVDGNDVFVAGDANGLLALTTDLSFQGSYNTDGHAWGIAKDGDYCYVADKEGDLYKLNVSSPSSITEIWHIDTLTGEAITVSTYGPYVVVGLLESPSGFDLRLLNPSDGSVAHIGPSPSYIGESTVGVGDYIIMADYEHGIKSWRIRENQEEFLKKNSRLHSKKVNTSNFRFLHWKAVEKPQDSSVPDTANYFVIYYNNPANPETLRILNPANDPPNRPDGSRAYFNLVGQYTNLFWYANIIEHDTIPAFPEDTIWRVDTVELEYRLNLGMGGLMRTSGSVGLLVGMVPIELGIIFDEEATPESDFLDVLSSPTDRAKWMLNGIGYRRVSLPYDVPVTDLHIWVSEPATIHEIDFSAGMSLRINGEAAFEGMSIPAGELKTYALPMWVERFPTKLSSGWNMISLPGTFPTNADMFSHITYRYNPATGTYAETDILEPGVGYFCFSDGRQFLYDAISINKMKIALSAGWNLVGGVAQNVPVSTLRTEPPNSILNYCIFSMNRGNMSYVLVDEILPWRAHWIFAIRACTLFVEPAEYAKIIRKIPDILVPIYLSTNDARHTLFIGIDADATESFDVGYDVPLMPPLPGQEMPGYLYSDATGKLATDIRPAGMEWTLIVNEPVGFSIGADYRLGGLSISSENASYCVSAWQNITLPQGTYRLSWSVANTIARPASSRLEKIVPNPFNSAVEIVVSLATEAGEIAVFDISGREVDRKILSGIGIHRIRFDERTFSRMATGIYFVRLRVSNETVDTDKMMLIK